jgi:diguanylate cyclase (GGDEF)-like protein
MTITKSRKESSSNSGVKENFREMSKVEETDILRLLCSSKNSFEKLDSKLVKYKKIYGDTLYAKLLFLISHLEFKPKTAKMHYESIRKHHKLLEGKLERKLDIRVAVADYFVSHKRKIKNPMILEIHLFREAQQAGFIDTLTSLYNYSFLRAALPHEMAHSKRYADPLSVIFFDLDDFKKVNDKYGHEIGNSCLKHVAEVIQSSVREMDLAFRYGGEEFLILLPKTDKFGALAVAERIRKTLEKSDLKFMGQKDLRIAVSGGVSSCPVDSESGDALVKLADEAMYRAKNKGKNRVELFSLEKRAYERFDDKFKSVITIAGSDYPVLGKNISVGGFYFEGGCNLNLPAKIPFKMELEHPLYKTVTIKGDGKITRVEPQPGGKCGIAVSFMGMRAPERETLRKYVSFLTAK